MKAKRVRVQWAVAGWVLGLSLGAQAQEELGRVLSSTPIVQSVGVPRQVCTQEQVLVAPPKSGAGAVMGAIAGGAVANAAVTGAGQAAATMLGIMGGAVLGDRIEGSPPPQAQTVQRCSTQTFYENRTVGYQVVYEYAGRQYTVQLPQDPGPTLRLQVTPAVPTLGPQPLQATPASGAPVVVAQAAPVVRWVVPPVVAPVMVWPRPHHPSHRWDWDDRWDDRWDRRR